MDNFTKGLLERNEMRNKALGLPPSATKAAQSPNKENSDSNVRITGARRKTSVSSPRKSSGTELAASNKTPTKRITTVSSKKEDADVAVEINITSTQNVQVEVEVQECEIDENGKMIKKGDAVNNSLSNFDSAVQLRDSSRKNLRRLGVLYSDTEQFSSPIQRTEENFCESSDGATANATARTPKKLNKLVSLAKEINNWDDDYSQHGSRTNSPKSSPAKTGAIPKKFGSPAKTAFNSPSKPAFNFGSPARQNNFTQASFGSPISSNKDTTTALASKPSPKKLLWDKKVIDSLEAQGFTRRESTVPKLVYSYTGAESKEPSNSSSANQSSPTPPSSSSSKSPKPAARSPAISSNTFTKPKSPPKKEDAKPVKSARKSIFNKDPADMSLKDRMAIFEKNKGVAPVPKTPYGITDVAPTKTNVKEAKERFQFNKGGFSTIQAKPKARQPVKNVAAVETEATQETVNGNAAANIKTTLNKLLASKEMTISEMQISENIRRQRDEEMKVVLNRFNRDTSEESTTTTSTAPTTSSASAILTSDDKSDGKRCSNGEKYCEARANNEEFCQKNDDKKRSRLSNAHRLYPILSDIEATTTDSEMDNYTTATVSGEEERMGDDADYDIDSDLEADEDEDPNVSMGKQILKSVTRHNDLRRSDYLDSSVGSTDVSGAIGDMDDYLNEAMDDEEDSDAYDDKGSACSDSFKYEKYPKRVSFKQPEEIPVKTKLEFSPADSSSGSHTLVHTVSFYRKQQSASANNTPVKRVVKRVEETTTDDSSSDEYENDRKVKEECSNKIQRLLDEVMRQQNIIKQTSQALNLCASTVEFSGSSEAVEGERHLLVATHRRLACMNEVQRLKVEGLLSQSSGLVKEKGSLSISDIIIPLKQTYISRLASDEISGHHLLCLLKYNEYVLASKTLPTLPGLKSVKFTDVLTFNEVFADFKITLEIYGMTAQREILPHDIKYHIQTPNKKRFKMKMQESNLVRPPIQSPGGPNAVRTPALIRYGYVIFSIREIKQKCWVINETASVSPLNGNVFMKVDSKITVDVNHSGFLTMFDDISGFGAWHRRWCRLSGNTIYYWKYPEDEKRKDALGQLDLTSICTERVDVAPRSICARLHTMLLETRRERRPDDVESLVLVPKSDHTIVRHLLAADTKEEREEWCLHLNKSLSLLKSWGHQ